VTEGPELWRDVGGFGLLTTADAARLAGFSAKTVRRAIADGELVASNVRGEYRIWPEDFRQWIDGRRVGPRKIPTTRRRRASDFGTGSVERLRGLEAGQ